jgi:heterodisulfide reductase subunit C
MGTTHAAVKNDLEAVGQMIRACIQCGTCTASCPNQFAMDLTPRRLWRLVSMGRREAIFASKTFMLCSNCYYCTLRCPRGLPLTEAMAAIKQIATQQAPGRYKATTLFYRDFTESVRRHGRVREMEFMTLYFSHMKNPLLPFRFAPLAMKLISRGKVPLKFPCRGSGKLQALFAKVAALEGNELTLRNGAGP